MHCFVNFVISMSVTLGTSISSKVVTSFLVAWEKGSDLVQRTLEIVVLMMTLKTSLILMSRKEQQGIIGLHVISLLRTNTTKVILKGKFAFAFVFWSRFFSFSCNCHLSNWLKNALFDIFLQTSSKWKFLPKGDYKS